MSKSNDVFSVLVSTGTDTGQDVMDAGSLPTALAAGQIGFFDAETNLSIDETVTALNKFYIGVGVGATPAGAQTDWYKSAGENIQVSALNVLSYQCCEDSASSIWQLCDIEADCETEYAIKFELRNQVSYHNYGFNQFTKTFAVTTGCCDCPTPECPTGDCNELAELLYTAINADPEGWITASYWDCTGEEAVEDLAVWVAANPDSCIGLRFTSTAAQIESWCGVNPKYVNPRETVLVASLPAGFECAGTLSEEQTVTYAQGVGYDIQQLEYRAWGWHGGNNPFGVYRQSAQNGLILNGFSAIATAAETYSQINISYDNLSTSNGKLGYFNPMNTLLAIPCDHTTTSAAVVAILAAIMALNPHGVTATGDPTDTCFGAIQ